VRRATLRHALARLAGWLQAPAASQ